MKVLNLAALVIVALLLFAVPAWAQAPGTNATFSGSSIGAGIGAALTIIGAGYGFGRIGGSALESMARQPEVAGTIGTNMLIIAALLEGATFFSLIVCILINGQKTF
jgi:F-type H+-transporting ATPase subunit c